MKITKVDVLQVQTQLKRALASVNSMQNLWDGDLWRRRLCALAYGEAQDYIWYCSEFYRLIIGMNPLSTRNG